MKLSILDQAIVATNMTAKEALEGSIRLAKLGDELGYERYWIAEHRDLMGFVCPNPSVMLSAIGIQTKKIRLGAGAVLLPYYKPFFVAETYHLLATLFPNRIDIGIGRAPGGSAEVSQALSDNYLAEVQKHDEKITELQSFLQQGFPEDHLFHNVSPTPVPDVSPIVWMLGTSAKSVQLAVEKKLPYVFGHFMTDQEGPGIVQAYRKKMEKEHPGTYPYTIVAIHVICAKTTKEAKSLAKSQFLWSIRQEIPGASSHFPTHREAKEYLFSQEEKEKILSMEKQMIIGDQEECFEQLQKLHHQYKADEYMILTNVPDEEARFESYRLIKEIVDQGLSKTE